MAEFTCWLNASDHGFGDDLKARLAMGDAVDESIVDSVKQILEDVRQRGDTALLDYTERFDSYLVASADQLEISSSSTAAAYAGLDANVRAALDKAARRIEDYAQRQKLESWDYNDEYGSTLGQRVTALDSVGIYVPGGKAAYPSSVLMNAIPARVAGVNNVTMVVPAPSGQVNPLVLAAAHVAKVDRLFTLGGAQAIAALAYGTQTICAVDKIVGPGNVFVAEAKRAVFGHVGIDMIAGPSEIVVLCDGKTDPDWIAMDCFSQAEHDELAQAILISPDADFLHAVQDSMLRQLDELPRASIIRKSMANRGFFVCVKDMNQAMDVINVIAPEHLELSVADPDALLPKIRHAGAIFMGRHTAEALGDYCAGPNHVLPTSATARFSSPLGVYDFQKRSSVISCTELGGSELGKIASVLAHGEGLQAHARSAEFRIVGAPPTDIIDDPKP